MFFLRIMWGQHVEFRPLTRFVLMLGQQRVGKTLKMPITGDTIVYLGLHLRLFPIEIIMFDNNSLLLLTIYQVLISLDADCKAGHNKLL